MRSTSASTKKESQIKPDVVRSSGGGTPVRRRPSLNLASSPLQQQQHHQRPQQLHLQPQHAHSTSDLRSSSKPDLGEDTSSEENLRRARQGDEKPARTRRNSSQDRCVVKLSNLTCSGQLLVTGSIIGRSRQRSDPSNP